jgi:hypothetical protein
MISASIVQTAVLFSVKNASETERLKTTNAMTVISKTKSTNQAKNNKNNTAAPYRVAVFIILLRPPLAFAIS